MLGAAFITYSVGLSPHQRWLREHDLQVRDYQGRSGWERHSLNTERYLCTNGAMTRYASGSSPEAAEAAFCAAYGLKWWKLDGWECAPATAVKRDAFPAMAGVQMETEAGFSE